MSTLRAVPVLRILCIGWLLLAAVGSAVADPIPATPRDFLLPGTQVGDAHAAAFLSPSQCRACHGNTGGDGEPYGSWKGSLMAQGGRDPLFFAQLATANQDVANVGSYCLRCHVPMAVVSGTVSVPDGSALTARDEEGVDCHFCHALVDPRYKPGISPPQDEAILAALAAVPTFTGNGMFVLDPDGVRRGPRSDAQPSHELHTSPYHRDSALCGTCHDVGNVAVSRQSDGTYFYNALDTPVDSEDPAHQFPLERTYTEWKLSAFAAGGVDMQGRFGGEGGAVVSSCQDCHMPVRAGLACILTPPRADLRSHDFAGASSWSLDIIGRNNRGNPAVDQDAIAGGMARADDMLRRAASLELAQQSGGVLNTRVINESGHKLPTGHIEGRRAWVQVQLRDSEGTLLREYGGYDAATAELDEASTVVYEMGIGLSPAAAALTGRPVGRTLHMSLADTIVKDTRIPPRGFSNAAFEAAGAPVVGRSYANGQYWDEPRFWIPAGAVTAEVTVNYQTASRHYIEGLREGNQSDHWGETLHQLWEESGRATPIAMVHETLALVHETLALGAFVRGDFNGSGSLDAADATDLQACIEGGAASVEHCLAGDFNGDGVVDCTDAGAFADAWPGPAPAPMPDACRAHAVAAVPSMGRLAMLVLTGLLLLLAWRYRRRARKPMGLR